MFFTKLILLDQIVKFFGMLSLDGSSPFIGNILTLHLSFNTGIAFGIGHNIRPDVISWMVYICGGFVLLYLRQRYAATKDKTVQTAISIFSSGVLSNLIDRLLYGRVVDVFLINLTYFNQIIFNLADIYISAGVCMFIYIKFFRVKKSKPVVREIKYRPT